MVRLWSNKSTVDVNGTVYVQSDIHSFERAAPKGDTCYNCVARPNMRLCDVICPHCKIGNVFVRRDA